MEYYGDELDEKYGLYNFTNFRGFSLQIFSFMLLGASTTSLSVLMMCLCAGATVMKSILLAIIFALPFLGIGLKFKTFNDSSLEEKMEKSFMMQVMNLTTIGQYYLSAAI